MLAGETPEALFSAEERDSFFNIPSEEREMSESLQASSKTKASEQLRRAENQCFAAGILE